jgi:hypothetical protein
MKTKKIGYSKSFAERAAAMQELLEETSMTPFWDVVSKALEHEKKRIQENQRRASEAFERAADFFSKS